MEYTLRHKTFSYALVVFLLGTSLTAYLNGWNSSHKAIAVYLATVAGAMLFLLLVTTISSSRQNSFIKHLSSLSYEIYLVHLPLLPLVAHFIESVWLALLVWMLTTYALSFIINHISRRITMVITPQK